MLKFDGKHICEKCGQEYSWRVRKFENGEFSFGSMDEMQSKNVRSFDVTPHGYFVVGLCPYCLEPSFANLAEGIK